MLAATLAGTALWSWILLSRSAEYLPWLKWVLLLGGLVAALGLLVVDRAGRVLAAALMTVGIVVGLGGPAAYALETAGTAHTGSIPTAGPAVTGAGFGSAGRGGAPPFAMGNRAVPNGGPGGTVNGFPGGGVLPGLPGGTAGTGGGRGGGGATGGLLSAAEVSDDVAATLAEGASSYTWVAAAVGSNRAAGYQLATELPVMPLGGFNGSDPSPTLEQFQQYVADGRVHWFIGGGAGMRSDSGSASAQAIAAWVEDTFAAQTVGGVTLYDLSAPAG